MIYLDNAATTPIDPEVLSTYQWAASKIMGNPSSLHRMGDEASRLLMASRRQIAELLGISASEIFFTSGGTEGDNWILKGVAFEKKTFGKHIIISAIEHPAIKNSAAWLEKQGFEIDIAPVDQAGFVKFDKLMSLIREDTILVSIMAVNNEVGSIQPIREISEGLKAHPTVNFHVDAVQALGKIPTKEFLTSRVDFASFSSHKIHGPRGVGFVFARSGKRLVPLLHGGGQENNQRSTTENVPGIAATAKALRLILEGAPVKFDRLQKMRNCLGEKLSELGDDVLLFSGERDFSPYILTFGIRGIRGEVLVHALEEEGIYVSTTSACASKKNAAASTLVAMGVKADKATTAIRISLSASTTSEELETFLKVFNKVYNRFQSLKASPNEELRSRKEGNYGNF